MPNINIRLEPNVLDLLDQLCEVEHRSRPKMVAHMIEATAEKLKLAAKPKPAPKPALPPKGFRKILNGTLHEHVGGGVWEQVRLDDLPEAP